MLLGTFIMYLYVVVDALLVALINICYCLTCRVIGKVVDGYICMVIDVATSGTNGWRRCYYRRH